MTSIIILISGSCKSWAILTNFAYEQSLSGANVEVIDFTNIQRFFPRSYRRKVLEKKLSKSHRFKFYRVKKLSKATFYTFVLVCRMLPSILLRRNFDFIHEKNLNSFISYTVESRLAQTMGTRYYELKDVPRRFRAKFLFQALMSNHILNNLYGKMHDFELILFNGREPLESLWIRRFLDQGGKVRILERASSDRRYEVYEVSPHFHPEWWTKIETFSSHANSWTLGELAIDQNYLKNKIEGYDSFMGEKWSRIQNLVEAQVKLPPEYVLFFATSTHEFSPIDEFNCSEGYQSQFDAVDALYSICKKLGLPLVIRRHPNSVSPLDGFDYEFSRWQKYIASDIYFIEPSEKIDLHSITANARVCFIWRSSIGVETIALGKSTYALGSAKWAWGASSRTWNHEDIEKAIQNPKPNDASEFRRYLAYMARGGVNLTLFESANRFFAVDKYGNRIYPIILGPLIGKYQGLKHKIFGFTKRKA